MLEENGLGQSLVEEAMLELMKSVLRFASECRGKIDFALGLSVNHIRKVADGKEVALEGINITEANKLAAGLFLQEFNDVLAKYQEREEFNFDE
jgi:hypothetical protein